MPTCFSYKKLAIFTTNVHTKNEISINYKTVKQSTEQPIANRCCYRLAFMSVVNYSHFYVVCLCHLSRTLLSDLCRVLYFIMKRWEFFKNNFSFGLGLQTLLKTLVARLLVRLLIVLGNCVGLCVHFFVYIAN